MNIATLRKKAGNGSLEVEHLLQAAVERLPGLPDALARLAAEHDWQAQGLQPDGTRVVPFAKWAAIASAYAEKGFDGLRTLASHPADAPFVLGLVEELPTRESVCFALELCDIYLRDLVQFEEAAFRLACTFNLLLSLKNAPAVTAAQARVIQDFLCTLYPHAKTESDRAVALLALRGIGDQDAIRFVDSARDFAAPWAVTKDTVLRALRKRVKAQSQQGQQSKC